VFIYTFYVQADRKQYKDCNYSIKHSRPWRLYPMTAHQRRPKRIIDHSCWCCLSIIPFTSPLPGICLLGHPLHITCQHPTPMVQYTRDAIGILCSYLHILHAKYFHVRKHFVAWLCSWWCGCVFVVLVRLNGSRLVTGVLRGFDPFMNLVIDEAVEECKTGEKNHIGMVVCGLSVHSSYHFHTNLLTHKD